MLHGPSLLLRLRLVFAHRGTRALRPARSPAPRPAPRRRTASRGPAWLALFPSWRDSVSASRAPDMPSGWPSAIAPPFGFTCSASSGNAEPAQHRERLAGERLVELDGVEVRRPRSPAVPQSFCTAGTGPMPMMRGVDAGAVAMPSTRARGMQPVFAHAPRWRRGSSAAAPSFTPEALPAVTVPSGAHDRLQLGERSRRRVGARMLVAVDHDRARPCPPGTSTGTISPAKKPVRLRPCRPLLAAQREGVLVGARYLDILRRRSRRSRASNPMP